MDGVDKVSYFSLRVAHPVTKRIVVVTTPTAAITHVKNASARMTPNAVSAKLRSPAALMTADKCAFALRSFVDGTFIC